MSPGLEIDLKDIDLPQERIPLHELQERYPHLATGPRSPVFVTADLPPPALAWILGAPWWRRGLALLLDLVPLALLLLLAFRAGAEFTLRYPAPFWGPRGSQLYLLGQALLVLGVYGGYYAIWESLLGWTPGKLVSGIRVVDDYGRRPGLRTAGFRALNRILDGLLLASVLLAPLALAKEPRRRAGDRRTQSWVVMS